MASSGSSIGSIASPAAAVAHSDCTVASSLCSQSSGWSPDSDEEDVIITANLENSHSSSTPPQKKAKKYMCGYRKQYSKAFPWSTNSKKGPTYTFCMRCNCNISMGQGGTKDLKNTQSEEHEVSEDTVMVGECRMSRENSNCICFGYFFF